MNLMFYDFNNSSASQANNTAQNFYNPNYGDKQQPGSVGGDQ